MSSRAYGLSPIRQWVGGWMKWYIEQDVFFYGKACWTDWFILTTDVCVCFGWWVDEREEGGGGLYVCACVYWLHVYVGRWSFLP